MQTSWIRERFAGNPRRVTVTKIDLCGVCLAMRNQSNMSTFLGGRDGQGLVSVQLESQLHAIEEMGIGTYLAQQLHAEK